MPEKYSPRWSKGLCYIASILALFSEYMLGASFWLMVGHAIINIMIAELLIVMPDDESQQPRCKRHCRH